MPRFLIVKATGQRDLAHGSGEKIKKTAKILLKEYNFTYNKFLYPYIDAHLLCKDAPAASAADDILIANASGLDICDFSERMQKYKWQSGLKISFEDADGLNLSVEHKAAGFNKKTPLTVFGAGTKKELFECPDYIIREYSRRLCTFSEIAVRVVEKNGGKTVFCSGERVAFFASEQCEKCICNALLGIFKDKMEKYSEFSDKYIEKLTHC